MQSILRQGWFSPVWLLNAKAGVSRNDFKEFVRKWIISFPKPGNGKKFENPIPKLKTGREWKHVIIKIREQVGNRKNPLANFGNAKQSGNIIFSTLFTTYSGSLKNILICTSLLVLEIATINNNKMISFTSTLIEKNPSRFLFRRILTKQNTTLLSTFHVSVRSQASHTPQFRFGINPLKKRYHWPTNANFSPFWLIFLG